MIIKTFFDDFEDYCDDFEVFVIILRIAMMMMMIQLRTASEGFAFMARDLLRSTFATDLYKSTTITRGRPWICQ